MVLRPLVLLLVCLACAPAASAASAPANLHAFLLRANEPAPTGRNFARTPAFAWGQVNGATSYEFQLSTSKKFAENAIVWEKDDLKSPLTNVPVTLPWMTGSPYSLYARVRAEVAGDATSWSARYGFRMKAPAAPTSLSDGANSTPGLVRWTPVAGANAYEVTFLYDLANGVVKKIKTATTVADLREFYTLHNLFPQLADPVWRVRAVREVAGPTNNRLPAVSYGPWSAYSVTSEPVFDFTALLTPLTALSRSGSSNTISTAPGAGPNPHELMPGFLWSGGRSLLGLGDCPPNVAATNVTCPLYHVYVYTDEDCVNRVYTSDVVGSPAFAPRLGDPLALPADPTALAAMHTSGGPGPDTYFMLGDGSEGETFDAGGDPVYAAGTDPDLPAPDVTPAPGKKADRRSGLWDSDEGHYYWTVVPVVPRITLDGTVDYHDVEFGEDMCTAGLYGRFAKTSSPVIERSNGAPFASGVTSAGLTRTATTDRPAFFGRILVAWKPAPGANSYQVQWGHKANPFKATGSVKLPATNALLNLAEGTWYYRVRGIDTSIAGKQQGMTWSDPQYLRVLPRKFAVVRSRPR